MINKILLKRGNKSSLPVLSNGEPAYIADEKELYIGTASGNVKLTNRNEVQKIMNEGVFYKEISGTMSMGLDNSSLLRESNNIESDTDVEYSKLDIKEISILDTISLSNYILNMPIGYCGFLDIIKGCFIYNELSDKILDEEGLYVKIEKLAESYTIITLTGKITEKMFLGYCKNNIINWKEVQFI